MWILNEFCSNWNTCFINCFKRHTCFLWFWQEMGCSRRSPYCGDNKKSEAIAKSVAFTETTGIQWKIMKMVDFFKMLVDFFEKVGEVFWNLPERRSSKHKHTNKQTKKRNKQANKQTIKQTRQANDQTNKQTKPISAICNVACFFFGPMQWL